MILETTPETVTSKPRDVISGYREELDSFYENMRKFNSWQISDVLRCLAGMAARASEIRSNLVRNDSRPALALRTKEVDPFLTQCDFQFKVWSRVQAVASFEWDIARGV